MSVFPSRDDYSIYMNKCEVKVNNRLAVHGCIEINFNLKMKTEMPTSYSPMQRQKILVRNSNQFPSPVMPCKLSRHGF